MSTTVGLIKEIIMCPPPTEASDDCPSSLQLLLPTIEAYMACLYRLIVSR